jgi:hypothetical protein
MPSTFTTNKSIEKPASGSFNNAWAAPVNADWDDIDNAFGGSAGIVVTGVATGTYALTLAQYQPVNIEFGGTLSGNLLYVLPSGVGGMWTVSNNATGVFTISLGVAGGGSAALLPGFRTLLVSDGINIAFADNSLPAQAQAAAEAFATAADVVVTTNANSFASSAASTAQSNAEAFSANASNLSSGTVPNARLQNIGLLPGVVIEADPGGTPTGAPGTMFFLF